MDGDPNIWRVCHVITGDCKQCPESKMVGGDECTPGCYLQAVECVNVVETGNPWRKMEGVRAPWIVAQPNGEKVDG
jgi:hypothetical protein